MTYTMPAERLMAVAARRDAIATMAARSMNAAEIAEVVGMTPRAVIGFCWRQEIKLANRPRAVVKRPRGRAKPAPTHFIGKPLDPRGCRWPAWGNEKPTHLYCCKPVEAIGMPYCAGHAAVAYRSELAL